MVKMLVTIFAIVAVSLLTDGLPTSDFRSLIKPNTPENSKLVEIAHIEKN